MHSFHTPRTAVGLPVMDAAVPSVTRSEATSTIRKDAVGRAGAYMCAHIDTHVPMSMLCQLVGLSERGLRDAFYRSTGMSPKRWIVAMRLQGARSALTAERGRVTTVTDAAAEYGFYELGRFAAIYREAFGEAPSATLRSAHHRAARTSKKTRTRQCLRQHVP